MTAAYPRAGSDAYRLCVENFPQICLIFGEAAAQAVMRRLQTRACAFLLERGLDPAVEIDAAVITVSSDLAHADEPDARVVLESLACALIAEPVRLGDICVVVALQERSQSEAGHQRSAFVDSEAPSSNDYLLLMRQAADAYQAVADGRLRCARQPVLATDGSELLYEEVLARIAIGPGSGPSISPACFIPAMERLGLIRLFDRQVVMSTITTLLRSPGARLACNISASSAVADLYWEKAFALLATDRDLAARFTIEVTETVPLPDLERVRTFVSRLQSFGCAVALDDFGVGHTSIGQALTLQPNIIKIDGSFLRKAVEGGSGQELLAGIVALASQLAPQVVLEGVEDKHHLRAACMAGGHWLQGYHIGAPALQAAIAPDGRTAAALLVAGAALSRPDDWVRP